MIPDDTDTDRVPVFDQLPPDAQDAFLRAIAVALLNHAFAELEQQTAADRASAERKAG
jgi:hypothetical protein